MSVTERYRTFPGKHYPERYPLPPLRGNGNGNAQGTAGGDERYPIPFVALGIPPRASRIAGRGRLLRSLRALLGRINRFAAHRAGTDAERRWACAFGDAVQQALDVGLQDAGARAALLAVDRRRDISRKVR